MLSDFNCQILSTNYSGLLFDSSSNNNFDHEKKLIEDIELLGSLGFHNLICQIHYDPSRDILYYVKKKIKNLELQLKKITARRLSGKFKIHAIPVTYLSEDTPYLKHLDKLVIKDTNHILLELPLGRFPDELAVSINKLLYSKNLLPIFSNFHIYTAIYSEDDINRLINIKGAGFQFPLKPEILSTNFYIIKHVIKNGGIILLGSSCDHFNLNDTEISKSLEMLKRRLEPNDYATLVLRARTLIK